MHRILRRALAGLRHFRTPRPSPDAHRFRPVVEGMEERVVPSAVHLAHHLRHPHHHPKKHHKHPGQGPGNGGNVVNNPAPTPVLQVPDLTNVFFQMTSLDNNTPHQLLIQTETLNPGGGGATFTGVWGLQDNGGIPTTDGQLVQQADGTHITFGWGTDHSFAGLITRVNGHWHIDGQVTVQGGGGPGHVAGDQAIVPDLTGINFVMTSQDIAIPHRVLIQSETINAAGDACFTGVWDQATNGGVPITDGHLGFDATGTHITFSWGGTHSFDGHVSLGLYSTGNDILHELHYGWLIDGIVTVQGGGSPGHLSGHQV
jgi:hypothetical protein